MHQASCPSVEAAQPAATALPLLTLTAAPRRVVWHDHRYWVLILLLLALVGVALPFEHLPTSCGMKRMTGLPCPFCGSTRTFRLMVQGYWGTALLFSPALAVSYVACGLYLAGVAVLVSAGRRLRLNWTPPRRLAAFVLVAGIIGLNYLYRIAMTLTDGFPPLPWGGP